MNKRHLLLLLFAWAPLYGAVPVTTVWEIRSTAAAGNVNGGGFNPANPNMPADLAADANTGNTAAPVVSSASYTFTGDDVNAWLYINSDVNWIPGWYRIAAVNGNKATLAAGPGQAVRVVNARYAANASAGASATGAPTGGVFSIDYSQQNTATLSLTDLAGAGGSTTLTSAAGGFSKAMIGNFIRITTTGTGGHCITGWYELTNVVDSHTAILDRTPNDGAAASDCSGNAGGGLSLGSSDDAVFELATASAAGANRFFVKGPAAYTIGGTVTIAAAGHPSNPIVLEGYENIRGDRPATAGRARLNAGAVVFTTAANWDIYSLVFTGTGTSVLTSGTDGKLVRSKVVNTSTTASRTAFTPGTDSLVFGSEFVSYRGRAITGGTQQYQVVASYLHDSDVCVAITALGKPEIIDNIFEGCVTAAIQYTGAPATFQMISGNTFYGAENRLGTALILASGMTDIRFVNNLVYGFVTGVSHAQTQSVGYADYNNYFNNAWDVSSADTWQKGANDQTLAPQFTSVAQLTGTSATTSGSVLTQTGADFNPVVDGQDYLYLKSGAGVTAGIYGITAHTATTLTLDIAPGSNATPDKVWQITTGHNFAIGGNLKGLAYPAVFPGGLTTGYPDIGAVQRLEPAAAACGQRAYPFVSGLRHPDRRLRPAAFRENTGPAEPADVSYAGWSGVAVLLFGIAAWFGRRDN